MLNKSRFYNLLFRQLNTSYQRSSLLSSLQFRTFSCGIGYPPKPEENPVKFTFVYTKEGEQKEVLAREGETLLEVAHNNKIDLEGACEQSLACSTCHVILEEKIYEKLPDPIEEEEDLLDLAYGLTLTSRLGCQVKVTKDMEGMIVKLPANTRNFYVDKNKVNLDK